MWALFWRAVSPGDASVEPQCIGDRLSALTGPRPAGDCKPLTSLRFLAALAVFISHVPGVSLGTAYLLSRPAISFFFILSGFILAYNYHGSFVRLERQSVNNFYLARVARVYPTHALTFLLSLPALTLNGYFKAAPIWERLRAGALNLFLIHGFWPDKEVHYSYNALSWSLSDEAFFYAAFPFAVFAYHRMRPGLQKPFVWMAALCLAAAALVAGLRNVLPHETAAWLFKISPFFRLIDFLIGVLLFFACSRFFGSSHAQRPVLFTLAELGSTALLAAALFFPPCVPNDPLWGVACLPLMALVIGVFAFSRGALSSWMSHPYWVRLGELSFAFYMYHQLIFAYLPPARLALFKAPTAVAYGIGFLATLLVSRLHYVYFETPMRSWIRV